MAGNGKKYRVQLEFTDKKGEIAEFLKITSLPATGLVIAWRMPFVKKPLCKNLEN